MNQDCSIQLNLDIKTTYGCDQNGHYSKVVFILGKFRADGFVYFYDRHVTFCELLSY